MLDRQQWQATAPGRVNLIGEHTDYNGGFCLPMAIDRYVRAAARPSAIADEHVFRSTRFAEVVRCSRDGTRCLSHREPPVWSKYLAGVVREFIDLDCQIPALEIEVDSDVPVGAGLSSSAALEMAVACLLQKVSGNILDGFATALLCQRAENRHVGVPCGLMDPLASALGRAEHALLIDCQSQVTRLVPLPRALAVVIVDSGVRRQLTDGAYHQRRLECAAACQALQVPTLRHALVESLPDHDPKSASANAVLQRARHVLTENQRTLNAVRCLEDQDLIGFGALMYESHESMRTDFQISTPELDLLVGLARSEGVERGVYGSRLTGGGFGGCTVTLVQADRADAFLNTVIRRYREETGRDICGFASAAVDGAILRNFPDRSDWPSCQQRKSRQDSSERKS